MSKTRSVDTELLYVMWASEVLLASGASLEGTLRHVADAGYGGISAIFKGVLEENANGSRLTDALQRLYDSSLSHALKEFLLVLIRAARGEGVDIVATTRNMAQLETKRRHMKLQSYIGTLSTLAELYMIVAILVPVVVLVFFFVNEMIGSAGMIAGAGHSNHAIIVYVGLTFDIIALTFLILLVKILEPEI